MLLRREKRAGRLSLTFEIDRLGGEVDALTGKEELVVVCRVPRRHAAAAVELLGAFVASTELPLESLESERRVVLEELQGAASDPEEVAHDLFFELAFPDHGLGRPVGGTLERVAALSADALVAHERERVHAGTLGFAAVGPLAAEEVVERLERTPVATVPHGAWLPRPAAPARFADDVDGRIRVRRVHADYAHVLLAAEGRPYGDPSRPAADVLAARLGGSTTSLLFETVRSQLGLAYLVFAWHRAYSDVGVLRIEVGTTPANVRRVVDTIRNVVAEALATGELFEELDVAKAQAVGRIVLESETSSELALTLARNRLVGEVPGWSPEAYVQALDRVTADDVHAEAARVVERGLLAVAAGHAEGGDAAVLEC